ncbi:hypothetical protein [Nostoc sp.]|uniref:hypothetical protein n=1 Tax=Nostoc sp. TaxID=1180 RepID=UPI002FF91BE9
MEDNRHLLYPSRGVISYLVIWHWALGIGHGALGIGHGALGMGHWALGIGYRK